VAIHIPIALLEESEEHALYEYSQPIYAPDPNRPRRLTSVGHHTGTVRVDKRTGEVDHVSGQDWDAEKFFFLRVAACVLRCHRSGVYPASRSISS